MIAGRLSPGLSPVGRNNWFGTFMPSAALVVTAVGSTCRSVGKFLSPAAVGKTNCCAVCVDAPASIHTPIDWGLFQLALSVASIRPDASGTGHVSIPAPEVTCTGAPPETETAQM